MPMSFLENNLTLAHIRQFPKYMDLNVDPKML